MKKVFLFLSLLILPAQSLASGYVEEGVQAIRNGNYTIALNILQPLALQGNPEAQFSLCGMYYQAQGVPKNDFEAARWCNAAAQNAHVEAMYNLGLFYQKGTGVGQNMNEAKKWYKEAADRGHENAGYNFAELNGSTINTAAIINQMPQTMAYNAAQASQAVAMPAPPIQGQAITAPMQMAAMPMQAAPIHMQAQPARSDAPTPMQFATNANAAYYEQLQPASGYINTVKDEAPPILIVENSSEPMDPITACIVAAQRGKVYDMCNKTKTQTPTKSGYEVASINLTAAPDASKTAGRKSPELNTKPHSFTLDTEGNFSTTLEAALSGKADAQANLGAMYRKGEAVARNYPEAMKWFEKSASKGNVNAMLNMASMYQNGEGVLQNHGLAYSWYNLAADRTQNAEQKKEAIGNVQKLSKSLTNEEIGNALTFVTRLDEKIPPQI